MSETMTSLNESFGNPGYEFAIIVATLLAIQSAKDKRESRFNILSVAARHLLSTDFFDKYRRISLERALVSVSSGKSVDPELIDSLSLFDSTELAEAVLREISQAKGFLPLAREHNELKIKRLHFLLDEVLHKMFDKLEYADPVSPDFDLFVSVLVKTIEEISVSQIKDHGNRFDIYSFILNNSLPQIKEALLNSEIFWTDLEDIFRNDFNHDHYSLLRFLYVNNEADVNAMIMVGNSGLSRLDFAARLVATALEAMKKPQEGDGNIDSPDNMIWSKRSMFRFLLILSSIASYRSLNTDEATDQPAFDEKVSDLHSFLSADILNMMNVWRINPDDSITQHWIDKVLPNDFELILQNNYDDGFDYNDFYILVKPIYYALISDIPGNIKQKLFEFFDEKVGLPSHYENEEIREIVNANKDLKVEFVKTLLLYLNRRKGGINFDLQNNASDG